MAPLANAGPTTVSTHVRARVRRWLLPLLLVGLCVILYAAVTGDPGSHAVASGTARTPPGQAHANRVAARPPRSCDVTVRSLSALSAAVGRAANDGKKICVVRGGSGPSLRWTARHDAMTRVVAVPADGSISIPGIEFSGASNITVKGFRLSSGSELSDNPSHIRLVGNQMRDMSDDAFDTHGAARDIWFLGNQVRNIRFSGDAFTGYGIQTFGGPIDGLHVNYNTFDMGGASADALQLGDVHRFEIRGNVIKNVRYRGPAGDPHADAIMLWDGASHGLVKDNRITDSMTTLWSGSTSDVRLENNLIARMRGWCHDGGPTGSSSEGLVRYTWVRNTIYDCGSAWNGGGRGGHYGLADPRARERGRVQQALAQPAHQPGSGHPLPVRDQRPQPDQERQPPRRDRPPVQAALRQPPPVPPDQPAAGIQERRLPPRTRRSHRSTLGPGSPAQAPGADESWTNGQARW